MSRVGELVTEELGYDGGRQVTAYLPARPAEALVLAGDGQLVAPWGADLEAVDLPATAVVGVHRAVDETQRLHEYSPRFDPELFAAHESFFLDDVGRWVRDELGLVMSADRQAVLGFSAGGELALALGVRHPQRFGAVLCASPGAGFRPPDPMPELPRVYLVAGTQEPFFLDNADRWATSLRRAGAEVVLEEREGSHGGAFWRAELPAMVAWAFG